MIIKHVELPYQMDVTALTSTTNLVIDKIIEVAKEYMVTLPVDVKPYTAIDLANYGQVLQNISNWQALLVKGINLDDSLEPLSYAAVDYNDIISKLNYYGTTVNAIIDAAENMQQ